MTKVECPGPGFKGLKWKWIQDHAKEQQERERERLATQQAQLPGATQPLHQQQQPVPNNSSSEPPQIADASEGHARASRQSNSGWGLSQQLSGHAVQSQPAVKVEGANGLPGTSTSPRASMMGDVLNTSSDDRVRLKEEQEGKAVGAEPSAASATHTSTGRLDVGGVPLSHSTVPASAAAASVGPSCGASTAAAAAAGAGFSLTGSGVSPAPIMPAAGLLGRKSTDVAASIPAASVSLSPVALTSPSPALPGPAEASHGAAAATGPANMQVAPQIAAAAAAASPSCVLSPPSAPAPSTCAAAAQPASAAPAAQPPGPAPSSAPPFAAGASRVRLPPARGPSMNVASASAKGGDDFESMFTPLLSIPSVKSETPRAGISSRSSSLLPGPQGSLLNAASGGGAAGTAALAQLDAGTERKGLLKKASRMQDGRSNAGQPSTAAAGASEQPDGEHGSSARSRTPVAQISPAAVAAPACPSKEAPASATAAAPPTPGKAQSQGQATSQPHSLSQPAQPQQQPPPPPAQQQQQLQHRASGSKHGKDGSKARDGGEGAVPAGTVTGGEAAVPVVGAPVAASRGGAGGDRTGAPASAGSTPAAAPAHSGGEAGERKRPRSEGSKPKGGISLPGDLLADTGWPYGETLADRIKRAKRATTSSSDQEGPHSHGSAERHAGHAATNAGNAAAGDGQGNMAGAGTRGADEQPPRPAVSAEAQSRGAEAAVPGNNTSRGLQTAASGGAAATGAGGANAKQQQQQRQQPPTQGRGKTFGRSDEPMVIPPALFPRSGVLAAEKSLDQQVQNPAGLRTSGGGAVTDSSGGPQRASGPSAAGKGAPAGQGASGAAAGVGAKRAAAEALPSSRRHNGPPAKFPRSDPHLPRPHQPHAQDRRDSVAVAAAAGSGRGASALPPPPASKPVHRASSGPPAGKTDGGPGPSDAQGPLTSGTAPGQAPAPAGPLPSGRPGRLGESDMPAAGSCKGPVVAGSRGSKDGAGDKGACGPRHAGGQLDAACLAGGAGGAGAAATTTTEPKTDSDTRTSRVVECFFELDLPCRAAGGSASLSGLGSSGSLQGGHGLTARLGGGSRFFGGGPTAATLLPRGGGTGGGSGGATATAQLLDLGKIRSFKELWTQLAALYDGVLPDEMDSKLIYLDEEGDWIMVTPDEPWSSVAAAATKVLVTNRT